MGYLVGMNNTEPDEADYRVRPNPDDCPMRPTIRENTVGLMAMGLALMESGIITREQIAAFGPAAERIVAKAWGEPVPEVPEEEAGLLFLDPPTIVVGNDSDMHGDVELEVSDEFKAIAEETISDHGETLERLADGGLDLGGPLTLDGEE